MLRVVFDRFLVDGPLDHLNWSVREFFSRRAGTPGAFALGKLVTCPMGIPVPTIGPDTVDYLPPPFDVRSRHELPAAGFLDFPLTLIA